jgi:dolichol-phosphate mannosyltransferase
VSMDNLLIAVATYNERKNVDELYKRIRTACPSAIILFVDDNSPDGTGEVVSRFCESDSKVRLLLRESKLGIGSAHKCIAEQAIDLGFEALVTLDGDLTHRPEDIPRLLNQLEFADVVVASRFDGGMNNWQFHRRLLTRFVHFLTRVVLGVEHDATGAFRAYSAKVLKSQMLSNAKSDGYSYFFESMVILKSCGFVITSVPTVLDRRAQGESKMTAYDLQRAVWDLVRMSRHRVIGARLRNTHSNKSSLK